MEPQLSTQIRLNIGNSLSSVPTNPQIQMSHMVLGVRPSNMISSYKILTEQEEKKRQFARSVYVSGFQKTVTVAMLERHFSAVKTVQGIKLPTTKFNENKGFAFIYFGSEDDAAIAKKQLDRSVILKDKIRVTKTVVADNLSKMIFKLKQKGLSEKQIEQNERTFFNDECLEKDVENVIRPIFGNSVQVNKIIIPVTRVQKVPLRYARVFFYVSNLKEALEIVKRITGVNEQFDQPKEQYKTILSYIVDLLNRNEKFSKFANAELYEYSNKNQSNVLHLKGITYRQGESMSNLSDELKDWIQQQNMQWKIVNCFAAYVEGKGAWANVTFETYDDTKKAYEHLKQARPVFRDAAIYGSLRNVKDLRTVVFSVVKNQVDDKILKKFLEDLADSSPVVPAENNLPITRKYQYFSFNIIEQKSFYLTNDGVQVGKGIHENVPESWRPNNTVPRRLVVHFYNDLDEADLRALLNDIRVNPKHTEIFMIDDKKTPLRANHQRGHIKNNFYVRHTDLNWERKKRVVIVKQPRYSRENQQNNRVRRDHMNPTHQPTVPKIDLSIYSKPSGFGQYPKITPGMTSGIKPTYMQKNMAPLGLSQMGLNKPPMMGQTPGMGGSIPMMGQTPGMGGSIPMMGQAPGMGGSIPMMGQAPGMGGSIPMMGKITGQLSLGGNIPQIGQKPNMQLKQP